MTSDVPISTVDNTTCAPTLRALLEQHEIEEVAVLLTGSRSCSSNHNSTGAQKSLRGSGLRDSPLCTTQHLTSNHHFDHATSFVGDPHCQSTPNARFPVTTAPLGLIDLQEPYDGIAFRNWESYNSCDNALIPLATINPEPLNIDSTTASHNDATIFDNLVAYSPDPTSDSVFASPKSKSSPKDISSNPGFNPASSSRVEKRKANTLAARRYRQKRLDRVAELESALQETQLERDALKMQLAKLEGETSVLRDLVRSDRGGRKDGETS